MSSPPPHGPGPLCDYDLTMVLDYYAPYVSGLTDTARIVAEALAAQGWRVAAVTTRHDDALPLRETLNGVDVYRAPVIARISKGTISPSFPSLAARVSRRSRVTHLHVPMLEAGIAALACRGPLVTTYYCDVNLTPGVLNRTAIVVLDQSARLACRRSSGVTVLSTEYARASRLSKTLARASATPVPPPCVSRPPGLPTYRDGDGWHVGFIGRMVEEKGVEYLVRAFRSIADPDARLLLGGDYERIAGGSVIERIRAAAGKDPRIKLLGFLPDDRVADFYASLDVFVLPSVNSLEAFGIVQVEAMFAGVPVVVSDLPGVRLPVIETGFGRVAAPRDPDAIREAILDIRANPPDRAGVDIAADLYGVDRTVAAFVDLYKAALDTHESAPRRPRRWPWPRWTS